MDWLRWYIFRCLIAVDQMANVVLLAGEPDETISARAWRRSKDFDSGSDAWRIIRCILDCIFFFDSERLINGDQIRTIGHCEGSYIYERDRRDMPPEYR